MSLLDEHGHALMRLLKEDHTFLKHLAVDDLGSLFLLAME